MKSVYLLTGLPGSGKTTVIRQAIRPLGDKAGGFYTEEIRVAGVRQGFRIVVLAGETIDLAGTRIHSPYRVSKYGVDIQALEAVAVPALENALQTCEVVVIDEIGRMELYSDKFKKTVLKIIASGKKVLGTIMLKADPWADELKNLPRVQLIRVTRNNHPEVLAEIESFLHESRHA